MGRSSPWSTPGAQNDWRAQLGNANANIVPGNVGIDDVSRALSALEINPQYGGNAGVNYQQGQFNHPPRFNPPYASSFDVSGTRSNTIGTGASRKLQLVTDLDSQLQQGGVQSASAYVPPIGHGVQQNSQRQDEHAGPHRDRSFTTSGTNPWDPKERILGGKMSNSNLQHLYQTKNGNTNIPNVPSIPTQYLNNSQGQPGQGPRMGLASPPGSSGSQSQSGRGTSQGSNRSPPGEPFLTSPVDVPTLIATKGYNPVEFDTKPMFVSWDLSRDSLQCTGLSHTVSRLASLSSNHIRKMMFTNR